MENYGLLVPITYIGSISWKNLLKSSMDTNSDYSKEKSFQCLYHIFTVILRHI